MGHGNDMAAGLARYLSRVVKGLIVSYGDRGGIELRWSVFLGIRGQYVADAKSCMLCFYRKGWLDSYNMVCFFGRCMAP